MKKDLTELVFVLDRSGSMAGKESDVIGGFNGLLAEQQQKAGDALVTTILFDDRAELLHDRAAIRGLAPLTGKDYFVRGCTAMLDAVGLAIRKIENAQAHTAEAERPEKTVVVINTDGMENASRHFTFAAVGDMVRKAREERGWEFLFLGANINAEAMADELFIPRENTVTAFADSEGIQAQFASVNAAVHHFRDFDTAPLSPDWKDAVEKDRKRRQ